ncbi:phosphopantothenoylcysteine decarboxylase [Marinicella sediminis]|uniref:Phosphopantothenoylcysteine decarboxylase n=1 Tax=Marinicella sediminis TaxID=1792834 RepID=A0ABV7J935_9GAMM|nr:phosphopantothenoylcysteine decarboxylase [Marinicella sediminis]
MNILITAGGTREYIDGVRYIGNCSSGQTGAQLADHLDALGHQVTWLGARCAIEPGSPVAKAHYETFDELSQQLQSLLSEQCFDLVFQAAAVSDFKVAAVVLDGEKYEAGRGVKLPTADEVELQLTKQPKLVSAIKDWSANPDITVVAFKLTNSNDSKIRQLAVDKLLNQSAAIDWVAHNDLNEFCANEHGFCLHQLDQEVTSCADVMAMADAVLARLEVAA